MWYAVPTPRKQCNLHTAENINITIRLLNMVV